MSVAASAGVPARASTAAMVFAVLLLPAPTISCAPRWSHTRATVSTTARCSSASSEGDDARAPGLEQLVAEALDGVERDGSVGREGSDERGVHALEQTAGTHGREGTPSANARARRKTSSIIGSVSLPVNVFCCDGWKHPSTTARVVGTSSPCVNLGRGLGRGDPAALSTRAMASYANAPSTTITRTRSKRSSSRTRYGRQVSRSSGVGLLAGGAQRTAAVTERSRSSRPSSADTEVGWLAKPVRNKEA